MKLIDSEISTFSDEIESLHLSVDQFLRANVFRLSRDRLDILWQCYALRGDTTVEAIISVVKRTLTKREKMFTYNVSKYQLVIICARI